jgi:hypothetical protein
LNDEGEHEAVNAPECEKQKTGVPARTPGSGSDPLS